MKLLACIVLIFFPSFVFATFPLIPVNQAPADAAVDASKTPVLTGSTLAFDSGGGTLTQSEWLVYEGNGTQVFGGRVTSTGEFIADATVQYQSLPFDGSFAVAGEAVATMDIDANGSVVLRNAGGAQLLTVDYDFDSSAKPQTGDAYVLVRQFSNTYAIHFLLRSDANSWSKTLEVLITTTGTNLVGMRISDPALSDAFFDNTFGDIGFTTHFGVGAGSDLATFAAWKAGLTAASDFTLACTVQLDGSCNVTDLTAAAIEAVPLPVLSKFTSSAATTFDLSSSATVLNAGTTYSYQVRYLADNGASDLYSNWSAATDFTTLVNLIVDLQRPAFVGVIANENQSFEFTLNNRGSDAGTAEVEFVWPFDVTSSNFSSSSFNVLVDNATCGNLNVSGGQTTQNCIVSPIGANDSKTIILRMTFPASTTDEVYALEYRACKSSCSGSGAAPGFSSVDVNVAKSSDPSLASNPVDNSSSGGGGAIQYLFLILLANLLMLRRRI